MGNEKIIYMNILGHAYIVGFLSLLIIYERIIKEGNSM